MIKVAVTGNIGSGKSTVSKIFKSLGIPVFVADEEAKKLYQDQDIKDEVKHYFGDDIYGKYGRLKKQQLADIIFNDKEALTTINQIIHPGTLRKYTQWLDLNKEEKYTLHESAILFENNLQNHFDKIINVSAPQELRLKRVTERDEIPMEIVLERMNNQLSDEEKSKLADYVIVNDGETFLIPQIMEIDKKIKNL